MNPFADATQDAASRERAGGFGQPNCRLGEARARASGRTYDRRPNAITCAQVYCRGVAVAIGGVSLVSGGLLLLSVMVGGCGRDADAPASDAGTQPPCDFARPVSGGWICAVRPSATDPGIVDDFGHHAVGVPDSFEGLYIFLKGTGGTPFDPVLGAYPGATELLLEESIAHGRLALMIAYDSQPPVGDICGDDLECFGRVRAEIIEGIEAGEPLDVKHVRPPNDVFSRIDALLEHLHAVQPARFPGLVDWSGTRVGGGSQGAGHAVYMAKLRAVERACALAGPLDTNSSYEPAAWLLALPWATPRERLRAVIHERDPWLSRAEADYAALGMLLDEDWRKLSDETNDPHGFVISDAVSAVSARAWACFE